MADRIVVLPDAGDGDILTALPAVHALTESGPLYLVVFNHRFRPLIQWSDLIRHPGDMRDPWQDFKGIALSIHICVGKWGKYDHPVRIYYRQAELPVPEGIPQPRVVTAGDGPVYDFVFAPWSHEDNRSLTTDQANAILTALKTDYPGCTIAVLGSNDSPLYADNSDGSVTRYYGRDFRDVAYTMKSAKKAVITVDSFPNRLAHAVASDKHVLLCSEVVPEVWGGHPGVRMLYGRNNWHPQHVLSKIEGIV